MGNQTNKTKRRLNVIDIVIIILVLALVASGVYRVYHAISNGSSKKGSDYIVTFECDSEYNTMVDYLKNGKAVYLSSNKSLLGYIYDDPSDEYGAVYEVAETTEESETAQTVYENNMSGKYEKVRLRGHLKLTSEAIKAKNGSYYTINGRNITEGSTLEVYTEDAVFTLTVKGIAKSGK